MLAADAAPSDRQRRRPTCGRPGCNGVWRGDWPGCGAARWPIACRRGHGWIWGAARAPWPEPWPVRAAPRCRWWIAARPSCAWQQGYRCALGIWSGDCLWRSRPCWPAALRSTGWPSPWRAWASGAGPCDPVANCCWRCPPPAASPVGGRPHARLACPGQASPSHRLNRCKRCWRPTCNCTIAVSCNGAKAGPPLWPSSST